jgi:hypothetical protein
MARLIRCYGAALDLDKPFFHEQQMPGQFAYGHEAEATDDRFVVDSSKT